MSSGIWSTTAGGGGKVAAAAGTVLLGAVVGVGIAFTNYVLVPIYDLLGPTGILLLGVSLLVIETGAIVSATLDWLEADADIVTRRKAWVVGHWTMFRRVVHRVSWWCSVLRTLLRHARRPVDTPIEFKVPVAEIEPTVFAADPSGVVVQLPRRDQVAA